MASPVGKTLASVTISSRELDIDITPMFAQKVTRLIESEERYEGIVRGVIEAINLHGDANVFRIYPDIGPTKVTCHFTDELQPRAIAALGYFVEIRGVLKRKTSAAHPYAAEATAIEIFPDEEELPTLSQLRGIEPGLTGELSSEDYVRRLRDDPI